MKKEFDARRLDVRRFAEEAGELESDAPLSAYPRLLAETGGRGAETAVEWSARGELRNPTHVQPRIWLHLEARTTLALVCQRCLQPVDVDVELSRSFRFVADEAAAAAEDEEAEEDVLAESKAFNLPDLVEDELLMDMPLVPRHEECPVALPVSAVDEQFESALQERKNPFEVLGQLKRTRH